MADSLLDQAVFGVYEVLVNIIPGTIVLITGIWAVYPSAFRYMMTLRESFLFVLLLFSAFVVGLAIQGLSAVLENYVNRKKYGGYPSSLLLKENDETFPKYFKDKIRQIANELFGTPLDESSQHIFDLCYAYVIQKNVRSRTGEFLRTYTFARNMMVTMVLEAAMLFILGFRQNEMLILFASLTALSLSYVFYRRFLRYGESFAKEVLRSFFMDRTTRMEVKK